MASSLGDWDPKIHQEAQRQEDIRRREWEYKVQRLEDSMMKLVNLLDDDHARGQIESSHLNLLYGWYDQYGRNQLSKKVIKNITTRANQGKRPFGTNELMSMSNMTNSFLRDDDVFWMDSIMYEDIPEINDTPKDQVEKGIRFYESIDDVIWADDSPGVSIKAMGEAVHMTPSTASEYHRRGKSTMRTPEGKYTVMGSERLSEYDARKKREAKAASKKFGGKPWWCPFGYGKDRCSYASCCHKCNASFNQGSR